MNPEDFLKGIGSPVGPKTTQELASWIVDGNRYPTYKSLNKFLKNLKKNTKTLVTDIYITKKILHIQKI